MSTSFKSFRELNETLTSVFETTKVASFNTALDALASVVYAAESVASEYAGLYSQVQWMKYSQEGDPDDVTPNQQLAIPDSVIAKLKSLVNKCDAIYQSIKSTDQTVVPQPGFVDLVTDGSVTPLFRILPNGSIQTGVTPAAVYKPAGLNFKFTMQYQSGNGAFIQVEDLTTDPPSTRIITDATYLAEIAQFGYGSATNFMVSILTSDTKLPIVSLVWNQNHGCLAVLNSDNATYKYFSDGMPTYVDLSSMQKFIINVIASFDSPSLQISLNIASGYSETTEAAVFNSNEFNPYPSVTIDNDVDPDLLYNNYNKLREVILGL